MRGGLPFKASWERGSPPCEGSSPRGRSRSRTLAPSPPVLPRARRRGGGASTSRTLGRPRPPSCEPTETPRRTPPQAGRPPGAGPEGVRFRYGGGRRQSAGDTRSLIAAWPEGGAAGGMSISPPSSRVLPEVSAPGLRQAGGEIWSAACGGYSPRPGPRRVARGGSVRQGVPARPRSGPRRGPRGGPRATNQLGLPEAHPPTKSR